MFTLHRRTVKFWMQPRVALVKSAGLTPRQITAVQKMIEARKDEIVEEWKKHFKA